MTQINCSKIIYSSLFAGLQNNPNNPNRTFTFTVASQTIPNTPPNSYTQTNNINILQNSNIAQFQVQFPGLDSSWYSLNGLIQNYYDSSFNPVYNPLGSNVVLELDVYAYYNGSNIVITSVLYNPQLSGSVTTPAYTTNGKVIFYNAPF